MKIEIHVAYSYSPGSKTYYAASYIRETENLGLPGSHSFKSALRTGIGDTREEAESETIDRTIIAASYPDAERIPVVRHGRKSLEIVQGHLFP